MAEFRSNLQVMHNRNSQYIYVYYTLQAMHILNRQYIH